MGIRNILTREIHLTPKSRLAVLAGVLLALCAYFYDSLRYESAALAETINPTVKLVTVVEGLDHPWSVAFLPDNRVLITERAGQLRLVEDGHLHPRPIAGLPEILAGGQGGLLDVVIDPDFAKNGWVYLSYSGRGEGGKGTAVGRGRLIEHRLADWQLLFAMEKSTGRGHHFGSRLVFDDQGHLYITTGDRGERFRSQDRQDSAGSVLRIFLDGRVPADNPWVNSSSGRPEIYSYGHRNIQGAARHPETGKLWTHEHGPQGGDELNIIKPGANYGWPVITYGREYGSGFKIGEGTTRDDIEPPLHYWVPSIAPSGMAFYTGDKMPEWQGDLFVGSLKFALLVRLELEGEKVVKEHRLLQRQLGRIRDVRNGPDGYLYLLTDASNGQLVRLEPIQ